MMIAIESANWSTTSTRLSQSPCAPCAKLPFSIVIGEKEERTNAG